MYNSELFRALAKFFCVIQNFVIFFGFIHIIDFFSALFRTMAFFSVLFRTLSFVFGVIQVNGFFFDVIQNNGVFIRCYSEEWQNIFFGLIQVRGLSDSRQSSAPKNLCNFFFKEYYYSFNIGIKMTFASTKITSLMRRLSHYYDKHIVQVVYKVLNYFMPYKIKHI